VAGIAARSDFGSIGMTVAVAIECSRTIEQAADATIILCGSGTDRAALHDHDSEECRHDKARE
jgi:hypothetical protein